MNEYNKSIIEQGKAVLGIEFGSTRIKAVLIDPEFRPIAQGSHTWENQLINGLWTYSVEEIWYGIQNCYVNLRANVKEQYEIEIEQLAGIGISAMMHGYMAFNDKEEILVPFRTWRNTNTGAAAAELSKLFNYNIPLRITGPKQNDGLMDGLTLYREYEEIIKENLEYDIQIKNYPYDKRMIDEIVAVMTDVMVSKSGTVRISGDDKPIEVVKSRFMKLDSSHLDYIMDQLHNNTNKVHNIRAYLLATIYNAPVTINNYYSALVNHDMYGSD